MHNFRLRLIRSLQQQGYQVAVTAPFDEYSARLEQEDCSYYPIQLLSKSTNPLRELKSLFEYFRIYSRLKPAVALHFTPKPNIYGALAARMLGMPCVNNIAGLGTAFIRKGWLSIVSRQLYKLSQRHPARVFFQNSDDLELFTKSKLVPRDRADLLPGSGVDTQKFKPDSGFQVFRDSWIPGFRDSGIEGLRDSGRHNQRTEDPSETPVYDREPTGLFHQVKQENRFNPASGASRRRGTDARREKSELQGLVRFLLIGRLIWDKGVGEFAEAARMVKGKHPEAEFWLLGFIDQGNPSAVPEDFIKGWEREGLLTWLGRKEDVRPYIAEADCVVLPSYYREGTPRTLLEAASMAKPLIAADSIGTREPVEDGITGYLCRPRDAQDLTDKMQRIIQMGSQARQKMGWRGREKMQQEYDENIVIDKYIETIQEICQS